MTLLYQGILDGRTIDYCNSMRNEYPHVVEICEFPRDWSQWCNKNMKVHDRPAEGCMGETYTKQTHLWGCVQKNGDAKNGFFLFFSAASEREQFIKDFKPFIVQEDPFVTRLK